jgi:type I restriction enzyme, S subunit
VRYVHETKEKISELGLQNSAARLLPSGTVMLSRTASVGFSAIMGIPMATTQDFANWICGPQLKPEFLLYALRSMAGEFERLKMGSTHNTIYMPDIQSLRFALPPLSEQTRIVEVLDAETAKIDALVEEQRTLIELLKEKRQAVTSYAITKGLNPNAPMKPSGVAWLGDVPAHWEITPLKHVVTLTSGGTPNKANSNYWDGKVPWASSKDLKTEELTDTQDHITELAVREAGADLVPPGCLLVVVRGMILQHTFPVAKTLVPMAINQDLKALVPDETLNVDFLACLLRGLSSETLGRTDEAAHGTVVLRSGGWTSMLIPIPPVDEQVQIVAIVRNQLAELNALSKQAQSAVELLEERRTALISAAVTGQVDVRQALDSFPLAASARA